MLLADFLFSILGDEYEMRSDAKGSLYIKIEARSFGIDS